MKFNVSINFINKNKIWKMRLPTSWKTLPRFFEKNFKMTYPSRVPFFQKYIPLIIIINYCGVFRKVREMKIQVNKKSLKIGLYTCWKNFQRFFENKFKKNSIFGQRKTLYRSSKYTKNLNFLAIFEKN